MNKTLTKPHEINYVEAVPGLTCGQRTKEGSPCKREAKWTIFWQHLHRGRIKRTRRDRCGEHGQAFFRKHGIHG